MEMRMGKKAVVIPGDGTGPEVTTAAISVLKACNTQIELIKKEAGSEQWEKNNRKDPTYIPETTMQALEESDACLKGATSTSPIVGTPKSIDLTLRVKFDTYSNIRPMKTYKRLSPKKDFEFVCFREATEGLIGGNEVELSENASILIRKTTKKGCHRIVDSAFSWANHNDLKKIVVITKRNIFKITDGFLWREVQEISRNYPEIEVSEVYVDNMAQQLALFPEQYNHSVLLSTNLFMDIISELAAAMIGGIGLAYSANIGDAYAIFEGAHGTAPAFAKQNKVNPTAAILSAAWMAEYLGEPQIKEAVFSATQQVINEGKYVTFDIGGSANLSQMSDGISEIAMKKLSK